VQDLTSWWEWLEEELMSPNSTLLPTTDKMDTELFAKWGRIKAGYLDYYNTVRFFPHFSSKNQKKGGWRWRWRWGGR